MAVQNNTAPQKRILVIDDDESILDVAELILTRKGYAVLTLQTGILLREVVEYYVPDLILLDVVMPGESGIEIRRELKKEFKIPIILFTASTDKELLKDCNAEEMILKPFDLQDLANIVEFHLNKK